MIKRTMLPNLAMKVNKKTSLSNQKQHHKFYDSLPYQIQEPASKHFLKTQSNYYQNFSSLSNIQINKRFKTQQSLHSEMNTIELKKINPEVFHTKVSKYRKKYQEPGEIQTQHVENKNIAPYFFKIHCSLKILQNSDDLKRKMQKAQLEQAYKLTSKTFQNSKKKIQKKITHSSSKKLEPSIDLNQNSGRFSTKTTSKHINSNKKFNTEPSELQNIQSLLEDRKKQLTQKGKEGKYTFQHFNSGEIFESIAELNQKKMLYNPDKTQYRVTEYCTYVNDSSSKSKSLNNKAVKNHLQESFKEEYNSFLKNKLPPSFGQNGNKSCIYEEWVEKRRVQQLSEVKSKITTRTEPQLPVKADFMFSNQVSAICEKKAEIERIYHSAVETKEQKMINSQPASLLKQSSTQTSKMVSELNSKMNTLRHGQSLQDKLKFKRLAKLQFLEKAKKQTKKSGLKSIAEGKQHSSLSSYSNNNNVSQKEMDKFMEKSQIILGKQFVLSNPVLNPQTSPQINPKILKKKDVQKLPQLNQYEEKYLQNVDTLLKKEISILRKQKQDLDSTPWRIPIKVEKKRLF